MNDVFILPANKTIYNLEKGKNVSFDKDIEIIFMRKCNDYLNDKMFIGKIKSESLFEKICYSKFQEVLVNSLLTVPKHKNNEQQFLYKSQF